jgi:DNA-binding Xre family transcriptional regulator
MSPTKRGRPRGLSLNPVAVEDLLGRLPMSKKELCERVGVSPSHLSDALHRCKGVSPVVVRAIAEVLRCKPETIAPELLPQFACLRPGDDEVAA